LEGYIINIAGFEFSTGTPDAADVIPQDRHAAAVSFLAQTLEDLLSTIMR
jgi:hypothetical protein